MDGIRFKLTVAIPVYNGEAGLRNTLDSIIPQILLFEKNLIEIIISDNASSDKTNDISLSYVEKFPQFISYYKNDVNLGYDMNVDLLFQRARGEYVWTMGCGEIIKDNVLALIINHIVTNEYDNIIVNFEIYSEKLARIEETNNFRMNHDQIFSCRDAFFVTMKYAITPLSANIILKNRWLAICNTNLFEKGWGHVERIIQLIASPNYKTTLYIGDICFTLVREKNGWWEKEGEIIEKTIALLKIIRNMQEQGYKKDTVQLLLEQNYKNVIHQVMQSKTTNYKVRPELLQDVRQIYGDRLWFRYYYYPLMRMPNDFFLIKKLHKRIKTYIKNRLNGRLTGG